MLTNELELEKNPLRGILICLLAYVFVSLIGVCEKAVSPGVSIPAILFFQNLICLFLSSTELFKRGMGILRTRQWRGYTVRILSGLGCYATLFYLIRFMPISQAFLYQYSASLWIPFITLFWLKVRMPRSLWSGILIGFLGIILILKPSASSFGLISLVGLVCGILQGLSWVAIRRLSLVEPNFRILFYYFLAGTLLSGGLMLQDGSLISRMDWFWLLGVGLSTYLAQKLIALSLLYAGPTTLAPVCYTCILFSGLWGWFFWQELPDQVTLLGMFLVVAGCLLSMVMSKPKLQVSISEA